jgi:hypothetical protein
VTTLATMTCDIDTLVLALATLGRARDRNDPICAMPPKVAKVSAVTCSQVNVACHCGGVVLRRMQVRHASPRRTAPSRIVLSIRHNGVQPFRRMHLFPSQNDR